MTISTSSVHETSRPTILDIQQHLAKELSLRDRITYVLLLLFDLAVGVVVASLLLTERGLPLRTRIAFTAILLGVLGWGAFFGWTLARRKVLLARHRLIAGRIAVAFTTLFTIGCLILAAQVADKRELALAAGGFGVILCGLAWVLLHLARQRFDQLVDRCAQLERELANG